MQEGIPVAMFIAVLLDCSLLAPQQGHSMRKDPPLDASRAPIRTIPHSRSCYGTPNAVATLAPTPAHLMPHNPKMITDCFLTDSPVAEIKGGCWPGRASSLPCCSARTLSALVLAAWVEPGNRSPDLALAQIMPELTLQVSPSLSHKWQQWNREGDASR